MVWDCGPPPALRIPGIGGAALFVSVAPSPAAMEAGLGVMGVDIRVMTPKYAAVYRRRPVETGFSADLARFLWVAASELTPERLDPFEDQQAGLSIRVIASTNFTVTLEVEVIAHENEDGDEIDGLNFETSRAALITASQEAGWLSTRVEADEPTWMTEPLLPLNLFYTPEGQRLTGIFRTGHGVGGTTDTVSITHYIRYNETAQGDVETSFLTSLLPFCSIAAHGVDDLRSPWVIVTQILPMDARSTLAEPWDAIRVARQEVNSAVQQLDDAIITGESVATQQQLVALIESRGVTRALIEDWTVEDLTLAGIAELANAPLPVIAAGRLTGCAVPDIPHDCPKDVFDCAFGRWQEMLFNAPDSQTDH